MDSAKQFVYENNLDVEHIQTIVEFIRNNTNPFEIITQEANTKVEEEKPKSPKLFPVLKPIGFQSLNSLELIRTKLFNANEDLELKNSEKALSQTNLQYLLEIFEILKDSHKFQFSEFQKEHIMIFKHLIQWPSEYLFACKFDSHHSGLIFNFFFLCRF